MARFADVLTIINGKNQKHVENPNGKYPIYGSGGIMGYADDFICSGETVIIGRKGNINKPIFVDVPFWNVDTAFGLSVKQNMLLPKYLFYFCEIFNFESLNTTVTIPSLTKANLLDIEIPLPTLEKQREIVITLDKCNDLIDLRKQQLEEDKKADAARLENMKSFTGDMASAMKELYSTGLAESRGVYNMFQALSVAETTISTYKAAQEAYAKGVQMGGVVIGAVWAAAAVAAGMGRIAAIRNTKPKGYAFGGLIGGADRGERADNVLIRATPGEYMLDRPAVRHYGLPLLEALRRRNIPREVLEPFAAPRLPHIGGRAAYAYGGEIGAASLPGGGEKPDAEGITVINVMDFQREFDRALSSARGRRLLVNVLGEEGITA